MTRRTLRQTIFEAGKHRPLILEIENGIVTIRPKGCRSRVYLNAAAVWQRGIRQQVEDAKRRRKK